MGSLIMTSIEYMEKVVAAVVIPAAAVVASVAIVGLLQLLLMMMLLLSRRLHLFFQTGIAEAKSYNEASDNYNA